MPFDGVDHTGLSLIERRAYHPKAPAVARVLATSLRTAYAFSRTSSNLIGYQTGLFFGLQRGSTYAQRTNGTSLSDGVIWPTESTAGSPDYGEIAKFSKNIPAHATHVGATVSVTPNSNQPLNIYIRVICGTETGTAENIMTSPATFGTSYLTPAVAELIAGTNEYDCHVDIAALSGQQDVTVEMAAVVVDIDATTPIAGRVRVPIVTAWWKAVG